MKVNNNNCFKLRWQLKSNMLSLWADNPTKNQLKRFERTFKFHHNKTAAPNNHLQMVSKWRTVMLRLVLNLKELPFWAISRREIGKRIQSPVQTILRLRPITLFANRLKSWIWVLKMKKDRSSRLLRLYMKEIHHRKIISKVDLEVLLKLISLVLQKLNLILIWII